MSRSLIPLTVPLLAACLWACASGGEKPGAKGAEEAAAKAPESAAACAAASADEEPAEPAEPAQSEPAQPKPSEILTTPDVAFAFDYNSSGLKEKHQEKCKSFQDKPSAFAACLDKERAAFKADVLQFTQDADGQLVWVVHMRKGTSLTVVYQVPAEFTNETAQSVTLKLTGQGRGTQQIFAGQREIPITLPDRYGLVIEDPKYGKLTYASKVGIVGSK
jgi:hypothetical protein